MLSNFDFSGPLQSALIAVLLLILAFIVAAIARNIVRKVMETIFARRKEEVSDEVKAQRTDIITLIGNIVYAIVFMLFLPGALDKLGVSSVSSPISTMVSKFLNYLPNIIAAVLVLIFGVFLSRLVKQVLSLGLKKTKVDTLQDRAGITATAGTNISDILANLAYVIVLVLFVVAALQILNLESISAPATEMVSQLFAYVPNIFAALVLIAFGAFLANLVSKLLDNVLKGTGVDATVSKAFPSNTKATFSSLVSMVVLILINIFFVVSALNVLNIEVLSNVGNAIIGYLPNVIAAALIAVVAWLASDKVGEFVLKASPNANGLVNVIKGAILVLASFMILTQLGIAKDIVNNLFSYLVIAAAVAFALAFGLGGKDWAAKKLDDFDQKKNR